MPSYRTLFPSKFLKAADLDEDANRRRTVTIARWAEEMVGNPPEEKPVIYFTGERKGLILNKTNADAIADIAGDDDMDAWVNVPVVLVGTKTDFGGRRVPCIRVEAPETPF